VAVTRESEVEALRHGRFDLLVIGGGATGAGTALDAASRGLRVALVERDDFSSGTSSRSTKLIHGGVRYLEQAVKHLDASRINAVNAALRERAVMLRIAPHLTRALPFLTPIYRWYRLPYYYAGFKLYDLLAGRFNATPGSLISAREARSRFPMLTGRRLKAGLIYYDGQFDDARMNLSLALTARQYGATIANHLEVRGFEKRSSLIRAIFVHDHTTGEEWEVHAQVVVNAAGPFADLVRKLDDPQANPLLNPSAGAHIVLDKRFCPNDLALLIPRTSDGRVVFMLPWMGMTLAGTTDSPAAVDFHPRTTQEEIDYLLHELSAYLETPIKRSDIKAAWSGLRPLVDAAQSADTAALPRDHVVHVSRSGLITVAGGKWTTYRRMAKDAVDRAIEIADLKPRRSCVTDHLMLLGAQELNGYDAKMTPPQDSLKHWHDLPDDVVTHLESAYGDRAPGIAAIARRGYAARLAQEFPYIEAEVLWAAREEMACTVMDVLARRTRLAFLDNGAADAAIARVSELLAEALNWDTRKSALERDAARQRLSQGL
jgi:glycerol-3-phosphate dehydrogenase